MSNTRIAVCIAMVLIAFGVILRLVPHPANFAPVGAIAIFAGSVLPKKIAIWVPLVLMMVSDAIIGFYSLMWVTWACFAVIALASSLWLRKPTLLKGGIITLSSSIFFYAVTNFAVWVGGGLYPHTLHGLVSCYVLALPFFRNTALSDACYTALLFGIYALALQRVTSYRLAHGHADQAA
jgi:hypothetical protein